MAETETRRERLRRELTADILRIARRQLAESGPGAVSWRGIAREVGMNPASLYTYFASLDDLYTALIIESFGSLADAVEQAVRDVERITTTPTTEAVLAGVVAYRRWAIEHPAEFNLVYADVLPGYAAPPAGKTVDAALAVLRPVVRAIGAVGGRSADPARPDDADPRHVDITIALWGLVHGLTALEVNHHVPLPDQPERFARVVRDAVERLVADLT